MAITRLTDIVSVFESKWTYGDVKFGYEGEINQDHDAKYPLMLIEPPESTIPLIYNGREEYTFEINFYNLYSQAAQSVVTLQKRWDNLQDLANEWLDFVLKNYQDVTVDAYLNDESIEIERVKEVANDRLVQLKLTFTMSAFTKCFRPVSKYPSDFSDLVIWLKADSGVTFDIPTKAVSAWADQSGNSNSVVQSSKGKQPLRYGYDGANDKTYLSFDGINDSMGSSDNCPISATSYTIFTVAKHVDTQLNVKPIFDYTRSAISSRIVVGFRSNKLFSYVKSGSVEASHLQTSGNANDYGMIATSLHGTTGRLTSQFNNESAQVTTSFGWIPVSFNDVPFGIGASTADGFAKANIEEVIVYNREITDAEKLDIRNYLNTKYKIY
tara:strand:+ start:2089 stop:3237 length:1149 start_codon:yes stop_codon:yes gene_type:complete